MEFRSSKSDKSDVKATKNLIEKLMALAKEKPSPLKSPKTTPIRKRCLRPEPQNSKITSWMKKANEQPKRKKTDKITQRELKMTPLDIVKTVRSQSSNSKGIPSSEKIKMGDEKKTVQRKENANNLLNTCDKKSKLKTSKTLQRTASFEKYGIAMPSFEKIVADQKKFDVHKENVKKLDVFDENILHKSLNTDCLNVKEFTGELLDCKHLSLKSIDKAFKKHLPMLSDIINGKKYLERHHQFHRRMQEVSLNNDLRCSPALVVFNQEQKDLLLDLMRSEFDPEDVKTSYFLKVLLPELCLLIFMDKHKMSKQKAKKYLDKRPLD